MRVKGLNFKQLWFLLALLLLGGCSTQNNTALSRLYHEINSQYNVYFNAKESVKEGLALMDQRIVEDYTHLLPIFPESLPAASQVAVSQMEYAVQKCQKLIATHSITKSPKRKTNKSEVYMAFAYKSEYNKWIDDTYLLMGQASYYLRDFHKSQESFNYILHNFSNQPTKNPAFLWLSRCYLETGEFDKALQILKLLERDGSLPDNIKKDLTIVTNSLMAAAVLMVMPHRLILTGGEFRPLARTLTGPLTASVIQELHFNKAFMGTIGFTLEDGMTTTDPGEAFTKEQAMRRANQVYLLADSSKLGVPSFARSGSLEEIDVLVTDAIGSEFRSALEERGVEVILA